MPKRITYGQAKADVEYLRNTHGCTIHPARVLADLNAMLETPTVAMARACLVGQVERWLNAADIDWNDPNMGAIARRYNFDPNAK